MENSCRETGTFEGEGEQKAMKSTQILLRYFVNAASKKKER